MVSVLLTHQKLDTKMKLISELSESVQTIVESVEGKKTYYIEGVFTGTLPNRNGRVYPRPVLESALSKFQETISAKRAMGELNHPQGPTLNLDRVSHIIENMKWSSNTEVFGRAKVLDTPMGLIAQKLLEGGAQLGVSTRGLGSLKSIGGLNEVQSDYVMNTVDIVGDPSYKTSYVNGILEGREWFVTSDGKLEEQTIEQLKKKRITEERKLKAFAFFVESLISK